MWVDYCSAFISDGGDDVDSSSDKVALVFCATLLCSIVVNPVAFSERKEEKQNATRRTSTL